MHVINLQEVCRNSCRRIQNTLLPVVTIILYVPALRCITLHTVPGYSDTLYCSIRWESVAICMDLHVQKITDNL